MPDSNEIWKPVFGYEGLYEVSSNGNVRRVERTISYPCRWGCNATRKYSQSMMKQHLLKNGYFAVTLSNGKDKRIEYVHRLVAESFCFKPEGKNIVNHKDENKKNNNYKNLEWTDYYGNIHWSIDSYRHSHNSPIPSTGYKYISKYKNKSKDGEKEYFKVRVGDKQRNATTIEEAISIREELLNAR